jgi:hypothetical protein
MYLFQLCLTSRACGARLLDGLMRAASRRLAARIRPSSRNLNHLSHCKRASVLVTSGEEIWTIAQRELALFQAGP